MSRLRGLVAGSLATTTVVAATAVLSSWPQWQTLPPDAAILSVSFSHGGIRACRPLSEAEMARLPANMRRREVCDRRRADLRLEIDIDGGLAYRAVLSPGGLSGDGAAHVYQRFQLPAGQHDVALRLADGGRAQGFDHIAARTIRLAPAESYVIDFRANEGGFIFK